MGASRFLNDEKHLALGFGIVPQVSKKGCKRAWVLLGRPGWIRVLLRFCSGSALTWFPRSLGFALSRVPRSLRFHTRSGSTLARVPRSLRYRARVPNSGSALGFRSGSAQVPLRFCHGEKLSYVWGIFKGFRNCSLQKRRRRAGGPLLLICISIF